MPPSTKIPYNPAGSQRELKVGKLLVVGNDSFATVVVAKLVRQAIETFDNEPTVPEPQTECKDPSAFVRAEAWAKANQNDARAAKTCSLF